MLRVVRCRPAVGRTRTASSVELLVHARTHSPLNQEAVTSDHTPTMFAKPLQSYSFHHVPSDAEFKRSVSSSSSQSSHARLLASVSAGMIWSSKSWKRWHLAIRCSGEGLADRFDDGVEKVLSVVVNSALPMVDGVSGSFVCWARIPSLTFSGRGAQPRITLDAVIEGSSKANVFSGLQVPL
jgi:hypothetical protein